MCEQQFIGGLVSLKWVLQALKMHKKIKQLLYIHTRTVVSAFAQGAKIIAEMFGFDLQQLTDKHTSTSTYTFE